MKNNNRFSSRWTVLIITITFFFLALSTGHFLNSAGAASADSSKEYVTTAANGDKIPNPISNATYDVKDEVKTVKVPEGMVYLPAGSFVMGKDKSAHTVKLSAYCIGKFEVTNAEYKIFCDEMGSNYRPSYWGKTDAEINAFMAKKGNHPALFVSYNNAVAYCEWLSKKTGRTYKVPSETQWERAARGPTTDGSQYLYPWGNDVSFDDYKIHLNYMMTGAIMYGKPKTEATYGNTKYDVYWPFVIQQGTGQVINQRAFGHKEDDKTTTDIDELSTEARAVWEKINADGGSTTPVGSYPPSPAGCYDMAGNAYEWTRDWMTVNYYITLAEKVTDPAVEDESELTKDDKLAGGWGFGNASGTATKIVRGGSWYAQKNAAITSSHSISLSTNAGTNITGFRIVMESPGR